MKYSTLLLVAAAVVVCAFAPDVSGQCIPDPHTGWPTGNCDPNNSGYFGGKDDHRFEQEQNGYYSSSESGSFENSGSDEEENYHHHQESTRVRDINYEKPIVISMTKKCGCSAFDTCCE